MHLGLIGHGSIAQSLLDLRPDAIDQVTILVRPTTTPKDTGSGPSIVTGLSEFLAAKPDIVIECAGHSAVAGYVPAVLRAGITVIVASVGALADKDLFNTLNLAASEGQSQYILPSGAIGGLDMLKAHSLGGDVAVTYQGSKPPMAWAGSAAEDRVDLASLSAATTFFEGSGREAALMYPKNANVVAALALAGAGFDTMRVKLTADPNATGNRHTYTVTSPLGQYSMTIDAAPSAGNAKTSQTTIFSLLAALNHEIANQPVKPIG